MALVYAFMADGLEEVECLATADILARAGITVKLVSVTGKREVRGSHGFGIRADYLLKNVDFEKYHEFLNNQTRYAMLKEINPEHAEELLQANKEESIKRYEYYQSLENN